MEYQYFIYGFVACMICDVIWAIGNYFVQLAFEVRERRKFMREQFGE